MVLQCWLVDQHQSTGSGSTLDVVCDNVLYKSTFTVLTLLDEYLVQAGQTF